MINGIRIRLARHGMRGAPIYHIVAIRAGKARQARPLEKLGEYEPIPRVRNTDFIPAPNRIFGNEHVEPPKEKKVSWDVGRIKYWLSQGAEPTGTVVSLLARGGILSSPKYTPRVARELKPKFEAEATPPAILKVQARRKHREEVSQKLLQEAAERDVQKRRASSGTSAKRAQAGAQEGKGGAGSKETIAAAETN